MIIHMDENVLSHYGVKGMRWGFSRGKSKADFKRQAKDAKERNKRKSVAKGRRTLSDKDLDSYISRLQKEKQLKSLTAADTAPGKTVAKQILGESGKNVLRTVITGVGIYAVRAALQKNFDPKEAAAALKPKK